MSDAPSQTQDKFIVRLPEGMRERIKRAAEANGRSMNAEVVATLEEKYPQPSLDDLIHDMVRMTKELTETYGIEGQTEMVQRLQAIQDSLETLKSAPTDPAAKEK